MVKDPEERFIMVKKDSGWKGRKDGVGRGGPGPPKLYLIDEKNNNCTTTTKNNCTK